MTPHPPFPSPVRGRLAPSPTGKLHLGNAYAFLAAWLRARSQAGALVLRMEDIDPERSRAAFAGGILEDLAWLGLDWDEGPDKGGAHGPYVQSERLERYAFWLQEFRRRGLVYPCYCTRKELRSLASAPHVGDEGAPYPGTCRLLDAAGCEAHEREGRRASIRMDIGAALRALGEGDAASPLVFQDAVLGRQAVSPLQWGGDFALRRSDGVIAYQLAVAVDDADMGISEVVRGGDLLASTPRQILLFRLIGAVPPAYAHLPLLHDASGERLAKRHKSLEIGELRAKGVPAEAVVGFLGFLAGWLDSPRALRPKELLGCFSLNTLAGRHLILPENPLRVLCGM